MSNCQKIEGVERTSEPARLGWKAVMLTVALHAAAVVAATYPSVLTLKRTVAEGWDTPQHLWIMRWYKTCLLEGKMPWYCPELQYPTGAPLGNFSPLHLQSLVYLPFSFLTQNDALCYNLVWFGGFLVTGLGTSLLCWHVLRDRACAAFGGLLGMLSGPMIIHAFGGHTELIYLGTFPIFLVAWMRFVDSPTRGRVVWAAATYVLLSMSAAYFMVFAVFPAALYVAWAAGREGTGGVIPWVRSRWPWFAGWVALTLPCLLVLFSSQIWLISQGHSMTRSRDEFNMYGSPLWSYVLPTPRHALTEPISEVMEWKTGGRFSSYKMLGPGAGERSAYLGVVTLALMAYALVVRARARNRAFLWTTLALLVVLSMGASQTIWGHKVSLPSGWLWHLFPPIKFTRVPSRFCMFAAVVAAALAAAGLKDLLSKLQSRRWRAALLTVLTFVTVADLSSVLNRREPLMRMPECYDFLRKADPKATLLEVPNLASEGSMLNSACTYWQAKHRLTTSAGYGGQKNVAQDILIALNTPLGSAILEQPEYLENPAATAIDLNGRVDFCDYLWLFLTVHQFDYIVLHKWVAETPDRLNQVKALLDSAKVFEDDLTVVYKRSRLKPPTRPVQLSLDGWGERGLWQDRPCATLNRESRVAVYSPDSEERVSFMLATSAVSRPQTVRLLRGDEELARWAVESDRYQDCVSPPFRLPAGVHELTIEIGAMALGPEASKAHHSDRGHRSQIRVSRLTISPATGDTAEIASHAKTTPPENETRHR